MKKEQGTAKGPKYRMLKKGDPVKPSCEFKNRDTGKWERVGKIALLPGAMAKYFDLLYDPKTMEPMRRRINSAKPSKSPKPRRAAR